MGEGIPRKGTNSNIKGKLFLFPPDGYNGHYYLVRADNEKEAKKKVEGARKKNNVREPREITFDDDEVAEAGYQGL